MQVIRRILAKSKKYCNLQNVDYSVRILQMPPAVGFKYFQIHLSTKHGIQESSYVESICNVCSNLGLPVDVVTDALSSSPELSSVTPCQWEQCMSILLTNGFTSNDSFNMIKAYPVLLRTPYGKLSESLTCWSNSRMGDKNILSLLKKHPQLLCVDCKEIKTKIPLLVSLTSNKRVAVLLKSSPNLMFQTWKNIEARINYLRDVMKMSDLEIVKSSALCLSLNDLKTRHVFLERCGIFTAVKDATRSEEESNKNPTLSKITDTSDGSFANKVAGLSLEEFEVFQELYALQSQKNDENSDIDSEEEK